MLEDKHTHTHTHTHKHTNTDVETDLLTFSRSLFLSLSLSLSLTNTHTHTHTHTYIYKHAPWHHDGADIRKGTGTGAFKVASMHPDRTMVVHHHDISSATASVLMAGMNRR
jgi:hypothetical protein